MRWYYFAFQEYTQEDLLATREKEGFFVAEVNY